MSIGADIDAKDKASRTTLHYAERECCLLVLNSVTSTPQASEAHLPVAQTLWSAGEDINAGDKDGKGAFDHSKEIKDKEKRSAVLAPMTGY